MRRLTLILSDLYLPDEGGADVAGRAAHSGSVPLPELEWLLRFASRSTRADDWRPTLAALVGCTSLTAVAPARFAARGRVPLERVGASWFATPVYLEARLDHVRLDPRGLLRIPVDERLAWCEAFSRSFGPEFVLHDAGMRGFFLSGLPGERVSTTDPARVLGADIAASLAGGADVTALRRLSAEIEMWLHGATLNRERERVRVPRVSSLWLWGGGGGGAGEAIEITPDPQRAYAGEDPYLVALARAQTGADPAAAPAAFSGFHPAANHGIAELAPMSEAHGGLARLDAHWFGPARAALAGGGLDQLDLLVNGFHFITQRRAGWRFWRRRSHWMDLLRRPAVVAQA